MSVTGIGKAFISSALAVAATTMPASTPSMSQDRTTVVGHSVYPEYLAPKFGRMYNCSVIPKTDKSFLTNEWEVDCSTRFTESGHFLVKQLLRRETEKALGIPQALEYRDPNRNAFSFVG